ncbi:helix-turn-helix transcriptional regulator [Modestobacter muralis]|uniref:Helix-turn-helix transcriptional regulator n=1 Tax=Modestobacter muralis TaxID=1608614 RepID=A0A6P0HE05_9ACTN|nr:helix-turn-helix transcriptional regulator [Modestobacter muralis]NEN53366.1 helix-turn-helix transcriptional regulator [Modestobacter muralis]
MANGVSRRRRIIPRGRSRAFPCRYRPRVPTTAPVFSLPRHARRRTRATTAAHPGGGGRSTNHESQPQPGGASLLIKNPPRSGTSPAVERGFLRRRRVEDYARELGYSPRTLSRASLAATGVGAKEVLDRRVVLEAKRLLAHTDRSAAQVGAQLGFSSATNFSKYFHQRTGTSPIVFRAQVRGEGPVERRATRSG